MTVSLRLFARSRCLRAIGALAWLMLVITSLAAAPLDMEGHAAHSMHTVVAAVGEHDAHGARDAGTSRACCDDHAVGHGDQAGLHCHCASMCGSVLPSCPGLGVHAIALAMTWGASPGISASTPVTAPPLRPPAV
jgi:hypothetical protein